MNLIKSTWSFNGRVATAWVLLVRSLVVLVLCIASSRVALTQEAYPNKPIRLVVPYPPGGTGDTFARILAPAWGELLKQTIVVENRGGAGSNIGADYVAKAASDGYTILLFDSALAINATLYTKLPYDVSRDLTPIMVVGKAPLVLVVNASFPAKSLGDLMKMVRTNPAGFSYASAGSGSPVHLAAEMFKATTGLDIMHVPYKGAGPAVTDVLSGQVPMMFSVPGTVRAHIASGKMRALAITGTRRFEALPDIPTFIEQGVRGSEGSISIGFMVPAKTPPSVIATLHQTLSKVVTTPEIVKRLGDLAYVMVAADPGQSAQIVKEETEAFGRVIRSSGVKAE